MPALLDVFYPIVPDAAWACRLVPLGVRTLQLRYKGDDTREIRQQIAETLELCIAHDCRLIVNDHWRAAIDVGADFVHLGQEDLAEADVATIKAAGVRLGISTHDPEELATALAAEPDYIALGPIWETKLKAMKWAPQGLARITDWKRRIGTLPLCAIGGITPERAPDVLAAGADSVAVITDFFTHADPESRVRQWLAWANSVRPA
jgi:thiamine-phosphate pyrophosphorylase